MWNVITLNNGVKIRRYNDKAFVDFKPQLNHIKESRFFHSIVFVKDRSDVEWICETMENATSGKSLDITIQFIDKDHRTVNEITGSNEPYYIIRYDKINNQFLKCAEISLTPEIGYFPYLCLFTEKVDHCFYYEPITQIN